MTNRTIAYNTNNMNWARTLAESLANTQAETLICEILSLRTLFQRWELLSRLASTPKQQSAVRCKLSCLAGTQPRVPYDIPVSVNKRSFCASLCPTVPQQKLQSSLWLGALKACIPMCLLSRGVFCSQTPVPLYDIIRILVTSSSNSESNIIQLLHDTHTYIHIYIYIYMYILYVSYVLYIYIHIYMSLLPLQVLAMSHSTVSPGIYITYTCSYVYMYMCMLYIYIYILYTAFALVWAGFGERGSAPKRGRHSAICFFFHEVHLCSSSLVVWQSTPTSGVPRSRIPRSTSHWYYCWSAIIETHFADGKHSKRVSACNKWWIIVSTLNTWMLCCAGVSVETRIATVVGSSLQQ